MSLKDSLGSSEHSMQPRSCVLGIDVGTEGCKAIAFDLEGKSLARSYQRYSVDIPQPSWAEQDPLSWWRAVKKCVANVVNQIHDREQILCLAVSGQSPVLIPVDKHGNALLNALIWMDRRAVKQSETIEKKTGINDDASMNLPKAMWIKENRPQIFEKTYKFLQASDFIEFKLTDNFVTDWLNAGTFHFDHRKHNWPTELLDVLDVPSEKLPTVVPPARIIGTVTGSAARETGLKKGTPVVAGGIDAYLAILGVNALTVGETCEITGSSTCLMVPSEREVSDPKNRVQSERFPLLPNLWMTWGTLSSTGASYKWFREIIDPEISYYELDSIAEKAPLGSNNLIFLPYLMGERSPIWDPYARGVFIGLSLSHHREHMARAILEGCAFGIRHNLEIIEKSGAKVNKLRSCGGAARSKFFGQIKADVTGKIVVVPVETEASALGAAILAAVGIRAYKNIREAARNMTHAECLIEPREDLFKHYSSSFQMYKSAYISLKKYFKRYYSHGN